MTEAEYKVVNAGHVHSIFFSVQIFGTVFMRYIVVKKFTTPATTVATICVVNMIRGGIWKKNKLTTLFVYFSFRAQSISLSYSVQALNQREKIMLDALLCMRMF